MVEDDIRSLVRGSFLEGSPIVRTSAVDGAGIDELKTTLQSLCSRVRPADDAGMFRMAIDRSFTVAGHGTVVTGTVVSGRVAVGDELEWLPAGKARPRARAPSARPAGRTRRPRLACRHQSGRRAPCRDHAAATCWPRRAIWNRPA